MIKTRGFLSLLAAASLLSVAVPQVAQASPDSGPRQTRAFRIEAQPVRTTIEAPGFPAVIDRWAEITAAVRHMAPGASVTPSPSTASISVTASPATLRRVAAYVDHVNAETAKAVELEITVLSLAPGLHPGLDLMDALSEGGAFDADKGVDKDSLLAVLSRYSQVTETEHMWLTSHNGEPVLFSTVNARPGGAGYEGIFLSRILPDGRVALRSGVSASLPNRARPAAKVLFEEMIVASGQTMLESGIDPSGAERTLILLTPRVAHAKAAAR